MKGFSVGFVGVGGTISISRVGATAWAIFIGYIAHVYGKMGNAQAQLQVPHIPQYQITRVFFLGFVQQID